LQVDGGAPWDHPWAPDSMTHHTNKSPVDRKFLMFLNAAEELLVIIVVGVEWPKNDNNNEIVIKLGKAG